MNINKNDIHNDKSVSCMVVLLPSAQVCCKYAFIKYMFILFYVRGTQPAAHSHTCNLYFTQQSIQLTTPLTVTFTCTTCKLAQPTIIAVPVCPKRLDTPVVCDSGTQIEHIHSNNDILLSTCGKNRYQGCELLSQNAYAMQCALKSNTAVGCFSEVVCVKESHAQTILMQCR